MAHFAVDRAARGRVFDAALAPQHNVAIVFGAAVGSGVLHDRVETGARLYREGKVRHLLMSGDNRRRSYDEPNAMRRAAIELGVPESAIVLDYAGRRTYDSCARARSIFQVGDAILVTQGFHLARAIYLCRSLGLDDVVGVAADRQEYAKERLFAARELLANVRAWLDVHVRRPRVVGGAAEPIVDEPDDPRD
jgi:vancomycin permeability regulator SanA